MRSGTPAAALQVLSTWERGFDEIQGSHFELIAALNGQCTEENAVAIIQPSPSNRDTMVWNVPALPTGLYYGQVHFNKKMKIVDGDLPLNPTATPASRDFEYLVARNLTRNQIFRFGRTSFDPDHAMNQNLYLPLFSNGGESWEWLDQARNPIDVRDRMFVCQARYAL